MKGHITSTLGCRRFKNRDYRRQSEHGISGYTSKETTKTSSTFVLFGRGQGGFV